MERNLRQRVLTAAALVPVLVAGVVWLPTPAFAWALGAFVVAGAWEWTRIAGWSGLPARVAYTALVALLLPLSGMLPAAGTLGVLALAVAWWAGALVLVLRHERGAAPLPRHPLAMALVGALVLVPAWLALVRLHALPGTGPALVLFVLVLNWVADSGAYFAGRAFGRRRLAPRVSPGKTWEGVAGACAAVLVLGVAFTLTGVNVYVAPPVFALWCLLVTLVSVLGDLTESLFKRLAGVKDSGTLFPGHGGVLDRIDSVTAAAPLFALLPLAGALAGA